MVRIINTSSNFGDTNICTNSIRIKYFGTIESGIVPVSVKLLGLFFLNIMVAMEMAVILNFLLLLLG